RAILERWQTAWRRMAKSERTAPAEAAESPPESFDAFLRSERAAALAAISTAALVTSTSPQASNATGLDALLGDDGAPAGSAPARAATGLGEQDTLLLAGRYLLGEPLG